MPVPQQLPPIATQPLSVVLLARNAAGHVESLLSAWTQYLDGREQPYELILMDDGSSDGTADLALGVLATQPRWRVLRHDAQRGEGAALRTALAEARHPLLFYAPAEPEYRPEYLGLLLDKSASGSGQGKDVDQAHILSGYRAGVPMPLGLRVLGWFWRVFCRVVFSHVSAPLPGWLGWRRWAGWLVVRILFALRYHDVCCPVRLMRREIFTRIPIQSNSSFVHVEILAKANFLGHLMAEEVPLPVAPPPYRGDLRLLGRDCRRLLTHPDFGPPVLPVAPSTAPAPQG
jgi:glycosyltransferase involved in cell wall biosynthesis